MSKRKRICQIDVITGYYYYKPYRQVSVERERGRCRAYYGISLASLRRAQRAQLALLERNHD